MARSIKKGPYIEERLLAKIRKMETEGTKNVIKTWSRRSTITPELIGYTFAVHNGKKFIFYIIGKKHISDTHSREKKLAERP